MLSELSSLLWKKCFKLNAAKKFFDILSGSEFVAFLGYGNEVEAFAENRLFLELRLRCDGFGLREVLSCFFRAFVRFSNLCFLVCSK